jgi:beta-lactamase regulating signal transducer with metallopeptidase domain
VSVLIEFLTFEYSIGNWLNPLSCYSCVQKVLLGTFFPNLQIYLQNNEISLVKYLSFQDSYNIGLYSVVIIGSIAFLKIYRTLLITLQANTYINDVIANGSNILYPMLSTPLKLQLESNNVLVVESSAIHIPLATYLKTIVIPSHLKNLSDEELEAVIAHEYEHVLWKDPQAKFLINIFSAVFWWIPTQYWIDKIEEDQEMSCDQGIQKYHLIEENLASAIVKIASGIKDRKLMNTCYLTQKGSQILKRVRILMKSNSKEKFSILSLAITSTGLLIAALCLFS